MENLIKQRHSVRAFLPQPIDSKIIHSILDIARFAPSGTNTQPWKVYVVSGKTRDRISELVCNANPNDHHETFSYYPQQWISPFIERRRQNGWSLYGLLGIERGDKDKMIAQQQRNFKFFDAPVALFFTINKIMGIGAKMDTAMMIQNVLLMAKHHGLDTCPQAAWNQYHQIVLQELDAHDDEELVCTVCLGYADPNHIVNTLVTPREPVENFTVFYD